MGNVGTQDVPDGPFIPVANLDNSVPMVDDSSKVLTSHSAYQGDVQVQGLIGKLQTSAGVVYGAWPYPFTATTNASGVATVYLTSDGTSTGTVAFTTVYLMSASPAGIGAGNYNSTVIAVSGDKKTLTITMNQITTVLGLLTASTTAAAGVVVQGTIWGK